jgi:hypothetical protein
MKLPVLNGVLFAALFASGITLVVALPAPVQLVAGVLLTYVLPGFVFLSFFGERDRPGTDNVFFSIIISPIILILLVLAFHATGSSLSGSVRASSFTLLALLALGLIRELRTGGPGAPLPTRAIIITCALFGIAVLVSYLINRFLLIRSDAWYHASIVNEIVDRSFPPKEPLLPDVPIRYMWIYHLFIASSNNLTGLGVFFGLALFNVMNALAFPYLILRLTSFFTSRRRDLIATPIFAISGLASAAWILWPLGLLRIFTGGERGWGDLMRLLREIDFNSANVLQFLAPIQSVPAVANWMVNMIDKFITITAFAFALNLVLLTFIVALSVGFEKRFVFKSFVTAFVLMLGALLFHIVGGMSIVLAVIGSGALLAIDRLIRRRGAIPVFHAFVLPGAAILAGAAAFPYILSLTTGGDAGNSAQSFLHFGITNIITVALPLAVLFGPARKALREIFSMESEAFAILATWLITLFVCNVFINLAAGNESKFVFPLFLILFPPILWKILDGIEAARGRRRVLLVAWTVLLFVIPPVLTYRGFLLDRPKIRVEERRYNVTPDDRRIYGWIASNTPLNSVLIGSSICDLSPVLAHRRDFYPDVLTIQVFGYDSAKIRLYGSIQDKFLAGVLPSPEDIGVLVGLESPIYVVLWQEDIERIPHAGAALDSRPDWFTLVYQNPGGRIYYVRGT